MQNNRVQYNLPPQKVKPNSGLEAEFSPSDVLSEIVSPVPKPHKDSPLPRTRNCHTEEADRKRRQTLAAKRAARPYRKMEERALDIENTCAAGGLYYPDTDRLVSPAGREAQVRNGQKVAQWRARAALEGNYPATEDLPIPPDGLRSKGERLAMAIIKRAAPESVVAHSEAFWEDGRANDLSLTFTGNLTTKVRDLDLLLSNDELYHVQVKGTRSWFYRLKAALGEGRDYEGLRNFAKLRSELLNTYLYGLTNELLLEYYACDHEDEVPFLPMLFLDYQDLVAMRTHYLTEASLLERFRESDRSTWTLLKRILKRAFPVEYKILRRAERLFDRHAVFYDSIPYMLEVFGTFLETAQAEYTAAGSFEPGFRFVENEYYMLKWAALFPNRRKRKKERYIL